MCLQCAVPRQDQLMTLDSFDLAFMSLTGHIEWVDPFDAMFMVAKASAGHGSKEYLWGPEADLMETVVVKAWKAVASKKVARIASCFDLRGRISVDQKKLNAEIKKTKNLGKEMWLTIGAKTRKILDTTVSRSQKHFNAQKKAVTKLDWDEYIAAANADHIRVFMEEYPDRFLHPEVIRLAQLTRERYETRIVDRAQLADRIKNIDSRGERYFRHMSDVQVGRTWTMTGLEMAQQESVSEYMVVAELDGRTCPVCVRLHGRHFSVEEAHGKMSKALQAKGARRIASALPFPRVSQIDNRTPKQVRALNLFPPFHGRCRCDIQFLWRA